MFFCVCAWKRGTELLEKGRGVEGQREREKRVLKGGKKRVGVDK